MNALHRRIACLLGLVLALHLAAPAGAERPSAPKLLPENTLAYVRVADVQELMEKFQQTSTGRLAQDDQIKPFLKHLYGSASQAFLEVEDRIGLSLTELLHIPQGELCLALVGPEQGRPALVALVEAGQELPAALVLLENVLGQMERQGWNRSKEKARDTELTIMARGQRPPAVFFNKDEVIAMASDVELAKQLLEVWEGNDEGLPTLADNKRFTTIMKRSAGSKDERPQVSFYVDPIGLVRALSRGNLGAAAGLAMLGPLGLDGLEGVGGSAILAPEGFDSITHLHVLLKRPREGVLRLLALDSGDTTPELWVPNDAASYMTAHWDFQRTYLELRDLFDAMQGEGALDKAIRRRIADPLDVDFEEQLLSALDGRVTMVTRMERPIRLNSQTTLIGIRLVDAKEFQKTLDRITTKYQARLSQTIFGGVTYYRMQGGNTDNPNFDETVLRRPQPCFAVVGDYLLLSDSPKFLEKAISTKSGADGSLADDLEFKLIASKISRQVGGDQPGVLVFGRPEESMRAMYELATAETTRQRLSQSAPGNRLFQALEQALKDNPLPPFAVVAKYLAPTGGMITDDETGIHYMVFGLKRE